MMFTAFIYTSPFGLLPYDARYKEGYRQQLRFSEWLGIINTWFFLQRSFHRQFAGNKLSSSVKLVHCQRTPPALADGISSRVSPSEIARLPL
jgi:hypothetical protein